MPTLQISLSGGEITSLEAEANEQVAAIVERMRNLGKEINWSDIQKIVASTIGAQVIRKALPELEKKTSRDRLERLERELKEKSEEKHI
jgi:hypothetical protein